MSAHERYVLLGVAPARTEWFRRVGAWATSAAIPAEFVRCLSVADLRARLVSGRTFSAALLDGRAADVDRDLLARLADAGIPAVLVDDATARPWHQLGAAAVLAPGFDRQDLVATLSAHARTVSAATREEPLAGGAAAPRPAGSVVAVTGAGGVGTSVTAIALAQGLAGAGRGGVLLADLCRVADQAMLHDSREVVPGLQELVDAHRGGTPDPQDVRRQTFEVTERGYRLLLGLRRPTHWVTLRRHALEATFDSLQTAFSLVVADIEPDLEGQADTGSLDVEDRHVLARSACRRADAVVVVGLPTMKGLHALVRTIADLARFGVPLERVAPVITQAPHRPRARATLSRSLGSLTCASLRELDSPLAAPVFLPRKPVDTALRDGVVIPPPLGRVLVGAVGHILDRGRDREPDDPSGPEAGTRVTPGSLHLATAPPEPQR